MAGQGYSVELSVMSSRPFRVFLLLCACAGGGAVLAVIPLLLVNRIILESILKSCIFSKDLSLWFPFYFFFKILFIYF